MKDVAGARWLFTCWSQRRTYYHLMKDTSHNVTLIFSGGSLELDAQADVISDGIGCFAGSLVWAAAAGLKSSLPPSLLTFNGWTCKVIRIARAVVKIHWFCFRISDFETFVWNIASTGDGICWPSTVRCRLSTCTLQSCGPRDKWEVRRRQNWFPALVLDVPPNPGMENKDTNLRSPMSLTSSTLGTGRLQKVDIQRIKQPRAVTANNFMRKIDELVICFIVHQGMLPPSGISSCFPDDGHWILAHS